jgi:hypothetical protein
MRTNEDKKSIIPNVKALIIDVNTSMRGINFKQLLKKTNAIINGVKTARLIMSNIKLLLFFRVK